MYFYRAIDSTPYIIDSITDMGKLLREQLGEEIYKIFVKQLNNYTLQVANSNLQDTELAFNSILTQVKEIEHHIEESSSSDVSEITQYCNNICAIIQNKNNERGI